MNATNYSQIDQESMAWAEVIETEEGVPISVHTDEHILIVSHCAENLPWLELGDAVVVHLNGKYAMVLYKLVNLELHQPAILPSKQRNIIKYHQLDSDLILHEDGKIKIKTPEIEMDMDTSGNLLIQAENINFKAEQNINFHCEQLKIETT